MVQEGEEEEVVEWEWVEDGEEGRLMRESVCNIYVPALTLRMECSSWLYIRKIYRYYIIRFVTLFFCKVLG